MSAKYVFPKNWRNFDEASVSYILENYGHYKLHCIRYPNPEPYQQTVNCEAVNPYAYRVTITDVNGDVIKIDKAYSPQYDPVLGGKQSLLMYVKNFSDPDRGFAFDAYQVNEHLFNTRENYDIAVIIDMLYKAVRARTIPTADQKLAREEKRQQYTQAQLHNANVKKRLLRQMLTAGDITLTVARKYDPRIKS